MNLFTRDLTSDEIKVGLICGVVGAIGFIVGFLYIGPMFH